MKSRVQWQGGGGGRHKGGREREKGEEGETDRYCSVPRSYKNREWAEWMRGLGSRTGLCGRFSENGISCSVLQLGAGQASICGKSREAQERLKEARTGLRMEHHWYTW